MIDCNDPARRVLRRLRPWHGALRALPQFVLLMSLAAVSSSSAAVADGSTAGAATAGGTAAGASTAGSPVSLPIRPCGDLTSERLLSPTRVPTR